MRVYLVIAVRNLMQAGRRTALLTTALGLVSMFLVLLLTLSQGISDTMIGASTLLYSGHINVGGFYKPRASQGFPLVLDAQKLRTLAQDNLEDVDYIIDRPRGWAKLVSETASMSVGLAGIDLDEEWRLMQQLRVVQGATADLAKPSTALIFAAQAKRLGVKAGDTLTLTAETMDGRSNTVDLHVAAVAKDIGLLSNWSIFVPKQVIYDMYRLDPASTGAVMVYLKNPALAQNGMGHLRDVLSSKGYALMDHVAQPFFLKFDMVSGEDWTGQKLDLTTWEDEMGMMKWSLNALNSISFFLICVLLLMIVVGITNSMWIAVRERTNEIGTLRAIGMGKRRVLAMFMTEAFLLGLAATCLGSALGAGLARGIDAAHLTISSHAVQFILMSDVLHLSVRPAQVVSAILTFTTVTSLAALWPALRAARLQPVTAMHRAG